MVTLTAASYLMKKANLLKVLHVDLLAQAFLLKQSGEKIVHDPRLVWNTF